MHFALTRGAWSRKNPSPYRFSLARGLQPKLRREHLSAAAIGRQRLGSTAAGEFRLHEFPIETFRERVYLQPRCTSHRYYLRKVTEAVGRFHAMPA